MLLNYVKGDHFITLIKNLKKKSMHIIILYEGAFLHAESEVYCTTEGKGNNYGICCSQ